MNPKSKKVLAEQGSQVVQALKWVGGAIFGDGDDVLDDMATRGDASPTPPRALPRRRVAVTVRPLPPKTVRQRPEVIDVEGFVEDDEEDE